jgi:glucose-1-phosphate cytidylyltransferase
MKLYGAAEVNHFVVALGYKGIVIKDYFLQSRIQDSSITVRTGTGDVTVHDPTEDDWTLDLIETGLLTDTGGRVRALAPHLPDEEFCLTYGDGVSDVDIAALIAFHRSHDKLATVTAIRPPARFGGLVLDGDLVADFTEKPQIGEGWINGGFMVLDRRVLDRIQGDEVNFERDVLENLANDGELMAFRHEGFWQSMDTLRDVRNLQRLWDSGAPPWRTWS